MMNHGESPYCYHIKDGDLKEAFWYENLEKAIIISRPKNDSNEIMDPEECLSNILGVNILYAKMNGAPENIDIKLRGKKEEEETLCMPPILYIYSLDGHLRMFNIFHAPKDAPWTEVDLLHPPQLIANSN